MVTGKIRQYYRENFREVLQTAGCSVKDFNHTGLTVEQIEKRGKDHKPEKMP